MKTTRRTHCTRKQIILAHILKHLMTSVPMIIGFLTVLGSVGSYELARIGTSQFIIQTALGLVLGAIGVIILNYFEN